MSDVILPIFSVDFTSDLQMLNLSSLARCLSILGSALTLQRGLARKALVSTNRQCSIFERTLQLCKLLRFRFTIIQNTPIQKEAAMGIMKSLLTPCPCWV
jgi:hypothetical protein